MLFTQSEKFYREACQIIPGGVNSPVRAFGGVGGTPIYFEKAKGAYLWDVDQHQYIDYVGSWGPAILGHTDAEVVAAVQKQMESALSYGAPTELETLLAKKIQHFMPGIEMVRLVSSGTEAGLSAIRLARGFTKRKKILKFEGCYHGHSDSLLVKAGSGLLTFGTPTSAGVLEENIQHTIVVPFNDSEAVEKVFSEVGEDLAAVIVEPIPGNMNLVLPRLEFLQKLRMLCDQYHTVFIIDEVMTGFRVAKGGAQALYNVEADLTLLAKIIGGGMPVGAFGGKKKIMEQMAPLGPVYQAGTLSGNPVAVRAGLTTLEIIDRQPDFYARLNAMTQKLADGLTVLGEKYETDFFAQHVCGMFGFYFLPKQPIVNYQTVAKGNMVRFKKFYHHMLAEGVYLAPSAFETGFVSIAHRNEDIEKTLFSAESFLKGDKNIY